MSDYLHSKAREIMKILDDLPEVRSCTLYGSLATGKHDDFSDIDIEIDVSGCDNGQFMLSLVDRLHGRLPVYYSDFAPSLIPERYIVSVSIDEQNPFLVVDLCCAATPHCTTVTPRQARDRNEDFSHMLKLWTANLKHHVRGADCHGDILRMARRIEPGTSEESNDADLLEKTLLWLERNAPRHLLTFTGSCRQAFEGLINKNAGCD